MTEGLENELWHKEATKGLENEAEPHSPALTSLHLHRSSFSNPSLASPTESFIY